MKKNYDFSNAVKNPYARRLKKQLTIRLDTDTVDYFQELSRELSLPYQTLMNMYLRDCATTRRRPEWAATDARKGARPNRALQRSSSLPRSARSAARR
jgi:antitoxin component of RelBE/YafQ-DinJ toxin-antitoxin module